MKGRIQWVIRWAKEAMMASRLDAAARAWREYIDSKDAERNLP
jgi:hypothetical protein